MQQLPSRRLSDQHRWRTTTRRPAAPRHRRPLAEALEPRTLLALTPQLFIDINSTPRGAPGAAMEAPIYVNEIAYWAATDGANGTQIWKSDGTSGGTVLVKDITNDAATSAYPRYASQLTNVNGTIFFRANDGISGYELWKTDGTTSGTVLVKDINPGPAGSGPLDLVNLGGTLFFGASDGASGSELWKSDGTAAGTVFVKYIQAGSGASNASRFAIRGGDLLFRANDGTSGFELWKSDGTAAGTLRVADINAGTSGSGPLGLTSFGGSVFFMATDGVKGYELWKSDGTVSGTVLVADIQAGAGSSFPRGFEEVSGSLLFSADNGTNGYELWKTDGTPAGTVLVKDIRSGSLDSNPGYGVNVNGKLFFSANNGTQGFELWRSDGTSAGTVMVRDIVPGSTASNAAYLGEIVNVNGMAFFKAFQDSEQSRYELWKSVGTSAGTAMVRPSGPGTEGSSPQALANVNGALFFTAAGGVFGHDGAQMWKSDGTSAGTQPLVRPLPFTASAAPGPATLMGGVAYFAASDGVGGMELWKTDGTVAGTALVKDIRPGARGSYPSLLTAVGNTLYFAANDGTSGTELWKSDGTAAGTVLVQDINTGSASTPLDEFTEFNGMLLFTANIFSSGGRGSLWKSSATGTAELNIVSSSNLTKVGGTVFFYGNGELWRTNGTDAGTIQVKDIFPGASASNPNYLTNVGGTLYFAANDGTNGTELWKSNGTAGGTVMVSNIAAGTASSSPRQLAELNGRLYFMAQGTTAVGRELWRSDGTAASTVLVKDIRPGAASSYARNFVNAGGTLFFAANDGTHGEELWRTDSTAGAVLMKDIRPGSARSYLQQLANINGALLMHARDGVSGYEAWISNGTPAGTVKAFDVAPGVQHSVPRDFYYLAGKLTFSASDGIRGVELWTATEPNVPPSGADKTITALEDVAFTLAAADFGFSDASNTIPGQLAAVKIVDLSAGTLHNNGVPVLAGQSVPSSDIAAGKLTFTGPLNAHGIALARVTFQVQDDGGTADGAIDLDPTANTLTFDLTSVNDSPSGMDRSINVLDHAPYTFSFLEFNFADALDNPAHNLTRVKITTLPTVGTLKWGDVPVNAGDSIPINAAPLIFTPAANAFATQPDYASFTFQVQDSGGTANGGVDLDPASKTLTINLVSVHNAPVGGDNAVTILEDGNYTFKAADFPFTDPGDNPADLFAAVTITTLPVGGTLKLSGNALAAGDMIPVGNLGSLTYTPAANANGPAQGLFTFQVVDDGGTAGGGSNLDATARTMTIHVTPVNDPPLGADKAIGAFEDVPYTFSVVDFGFSDPADLALPFGPHTLLSVIFTAAPVGGTLELGSSPVATFPIEVAVADVAANNVRFVPALDANSTNTPLFRLAFQLRDNGGTANGASDIDPIPNLLTFSVQSRNDPPTSADITIDGREDKTHVFTDVNFLFGDAADGPPQSHTLANVILTVPTASSGILRLRGTAQVPGSEAIVPMSEIQGGQLAFTPAANINAGNAPSPTIQFLVQDDGGIAFGGSDTSVTANAITFHLASVNDPPVGEDKTVTTLEDQNYFFKTDDFIFSDPGDNPFSGLLQVVIVTVPPIGTLRNGPTVITPGSAVPGAALAANALSYDPPSNGNGLAPALEAFTFRLQDDGGTTNGGVDLDVIPRTMSISVTPVNDAPHGANKTITINEDTAYTLAAPDFGYSDPDELGPPSSSPPNSLLNVIFMAPPLNGHLSVNGAPIMVFPATYSATALTGVQFIPDANENSSTTGTFDITFRVQDDGGTANGGVDTEPVTRTIGFNVTPVNDAPTGTNKSISINEDAITTLTVSDFGFSDPADFSPDSLISVLLSSAPVGGLLYRGSELIGVGDLVPVPLIAANQLTFVPSANVNSVNTADIGIRFQVKDSGGTVAGGNDLDPTHNSLSFNIGPINDAPTFIGANVAASDEDGPRTIVNWGLSAAGGGPDEAIQQLQLAIQQNTNPSIFAAPPVLDRSGTLTFTPKPNISGTAQITVVVTDDGGTALGGVDRIEKLFTIEITKPHPWHNALLALDVTGNGNIVAGDALAVINYINAFGTGDVPEPAPPVPPYYDCVGNNVITAADALAIINYINAFGPFLPPAIESANASMVSTDLLTLLALDLTTQRRHRRFPA